MGIKYNLWSFILCLLLLVLSLQSLYASYYRTWQVAPPALTLWFLTVIAFVTGIIGFKDKSSRRARWRSWLTVLIAFHPFGNFSIRGSGKYICERTH